MDRSIATWHQKFCDFCITFKGNTPKTILWYKDAIKSFQHFVPAQSLEDITEGAIETWMLQGKQQRQWSAKTIRERLKAIDLFFKWLLKKEIVQHNPVEKVDAPRIPKSLPKFLPLDQAELLLAWTRNYPYTYKFETARAHAIIATFLYTGIRKFEIQNLELCDVDLANKNMFIRAGKGQKDRNIPISDKLLPILKSYLQARQKLNRPNPYFFTTLRKGTRISSCVIDKLTHKVRQKSGINFSPHKLRHTFAVLMLESGCNIYALSKMLGHSDIRTTTIYLAATTSHLRDQIRKFPL